MVSLNVQHATTGPAASRHSQFRTYCIKRVDISRIRLYGRPPAPHPGQTPRGPLFPSPAEVRQIRSNSRGYPSKTDVSGGPRRFIQPQTPNLVIIWFLSSSGGTREHFVQSTMHVPLPPICALWPDFADISIVLRGRTSLVGGGVH